MWAAAMVADPSAVLPILAKIAIAQDDAPLYSLWFFLVLPFSDLSALLLSSAISVSARNRSVSRTSFTV